MLRSKYGVSIEDYERMLEAQGGGCAICGRASEEGLVVDHDHETGDVRGLLCTPCNQGLGCFGDDRSRLAASIAYLNQDPVLRIPQQLRLVAGDDSSGAAY